jgi:hypothetical protein
VPRPIRPAEDRKGGNFLGNHPASTTVRHRPVDPQAHASFVSGLRARLAERR